MNSLQPEVASVFKIVITGNMDQINQAINNYKDPVLIHKPLDYSDTSVIYQLMSSDFHCKSLFQKKDSDGRNLLHYACMYNTDEVATWLLSLTYTYSELTMLETDNFGATPVMYSAMSGRVNFVKEWIERKLDIYSKDKEGRNILHYCCGAGANIPEHPEAVGEVTKDGIIQVVYIDLDNGVDYTLVDARGMLPTQYILDINLQEKWFTLDSADTKRRWKEIFERVILNLKPHEALMGCMHMQVAGCFKKNFRDRNNRLSNLEEQIKAGNLDVNETDEKGMTALHHLCYYEFDCEPYGLRGVLVEKLLKLGANPNMKDIRGFTPLRCI